MIEQAHVLDDPINVLAHWPSGKPPQVLAIEHNGEKHSKLKTFHVWKESTGEIDSTHLTFHNDEWSFEALLEDRPNGLSWRLKRKVRM